MPSENKASSSSEFISAIAGGTAVIAHAALGGLFIENVKLEKQRLYKNESYFKISARLLRQGPAGFLAGFWPWGCLLAAVRGSVLSSSRKFFGSKFRNFDATRAHADDLAGFCAGAMQGLATSPILLARVRVLQSIAERSQASIAKGGSEIVCQGLRDEMRLSSHILSEAIRTEGVSVLTRGMATMGVKRAFDWGTRFYLIDWTRDLLKTATGQSKLNHGQTLLTDFVGGALSCLFTNPLDRLMPVIQQAGMKGQGTISVLMGLLKREGVITLWRGFAFRAVHSGYHTMFAVHVADSLATVLSSLTVNQSTAPTKAVSLSAK